MTPWNAARDFVESRSARDTSQDTAPSASFDPARTGAPAQVGYGRADLEVGRVGSPSSFDAPRNPIGFAPPVEPGTTREPRYRTELSFKRHHAPSTHSIARSQAPGATGSPDTGWPVPTDDRPAAEAPMMSAGDLPEDKVPFYKRELSFRRRKPEAEAGHTPADDSFDAGVIADDPPADGPLAQEATVEAQAEHILAEPLLEDAVAPEALEDDPVALETEASEETAAEPPAEDASPVEGSDEPTLDEPTLEEPAEIAEPLAPVPATPRNGRTFGPRRDGAPEAKPGRKAGRGRGKKVVGLKIGASQIAAAVVSETGAGHELVQIERRSIDSGLVVDGEIRDAEALAQIVKAFFDEHKLPKRDVRIGLASNRIGVRTLEIAGIEDEERFDNAVRFKAHEVLPVAQHESVLDYRVLEERPNEAGEPSRRILLVVAPRDQVEPYTRLAHLAGIRLTGLDLEALSLLRAFVEPQPFAVRAIDDTATVIVSIGHESTTLLVAGGGACEFTRVFDWGGGTLQEAVAQELDVHPAEAATILRHLSLSGPGRQLETLDEVARGRAIEAVRMRLTPFARELVASLQFYQTQPASLGIGEIVITGGTSHLEGLGDALHQMIGVSVRLGDPLGRVAVATAIAPSIEATIGSMAVPIGLAIEDGRVRGVNLLPKDVQAAARKRPGLVGLALPVAAAIPLAALGFLFVSASGKVSDSQSQLDAIRAEIAALPQPRGPQIDASIQGDQAVRAQAVANVLGARVPWDAVLRDVSRVLPENVWLTSLQAQVPATASADAAAVAAASAGIATTPTGAQIEGFTFSHPDVARLLARLATLPTLANVTLTSSTVEAKGEKSIVRFLIAADLNTGGSR